MKRKRTYKFRRRQWYRYNSSSVSANSASRRAGAEDEGNDITPALTGNILRNNGDSSSAPANSASISAGAEDESNEISTPGKWVNRNGYLYWDSPPVSKENQIPLPRSIVGDGHSFLTYSANPPSRNVGTKAKSLIEVMDQMVFVVEVPYVQHIGCKELKDGMGYRHGFKSKVTALAHRNGIRKAIGQTDSEPA